MIDKIPNCIYCYQNNPDIFKKKAHIISQFMGNFEPDIYFEGDIVCDDCNKILGDTIEKHFSEKSFEGLIARFHLRRKRKNQSPVMIYNSDLLKINFSSDINVGFNELLLLLKSVLIKINVVKDPIMLLKKKDLYAFIFPEDVASITSEQKLKSLRYKIREFRKDAEYAEWVSDRDDAQTIVEKAFEKLKLKAETWKKEVNNDPKRIRTTFIADQQVNISTARFVAKIAFEYFAYCAKATGEATRKILFSDEFKDITAFIKESKFNKDFPVKLINNDFVTKSNGQGNNYYFVEFEIFKGKLIGKIAFMDSIAYEVILGKNPFHLSANRVGNSHAFNLTTKQVKKMYNSRTVPLINRNQFSIYNK